VPSTNHVVIHFVCSQKRNYNTQGLRTVLFVLVLGIMELDHLERIAKLRKVTYESVEALATSPEQLAEKNADAFKTAHQAVKSDTRSFSDASRPRGMALAGPGFEAHGPPPADTRIEERAAAAVTALRVELKIETARLGGRASEGMVVKEEQQGAVFVGRDKPDSFVCVVKVVGSKIQDAFVLRADEKPGKNFCNRSSQFAHWRKATRLLNEELGAGRIASVADVWTWCQQL
jgi:hypothetical protein